MVAGLKPTLDKASLRNQQYIDELLQTRKDVRKIGMELRASAHRNRLLELRNAKLNGTLKSLERLRDEGRLAGTSSSPNRGVNGGNSRSSSASSSRGDAINRGAALDAAQDMVLYLRNEIALLKDELEKVKTYFETGKNVSEEIVEVSKVNEKKKKTAEIKRVVKTNYFPNRLIGKS